MALSRGAAPVGLQASTARAAAEGGGPPEAVVDWDVASRARRMQRLYGLAVLVAGRVATKKDMRPGATNLQRGAHDAYQLHFEPLGALEFDDEYSG
jgi:hypothetical protein